VSQTDATGKPRRFGPGGYRLPRLTTTFTFAPWGRLRPATGDWRMIRPFLTLAE
jgi:hypothetical protein